MIPQIHQATAVGANAKFVFPGTSPYAFGTWRLSEGNYENSSTEDILKRILKCMELGITTFDLADIYGGYTYEALFGDALALGLNEGSIKSREEVTLVTKCDIQYPVGAGRPEVKFHYYDTSSSYIRWSVERSLEKLRTPYIDVLLLHRPDPLMDAKEMATLFIALKNEGKVRHFGVSNFTPSQFELLQAFLPFPLVTNQVEFNVLHTEPLFDGTFDLAQRRGFHPMIWSPLAGGRIFNKEVEKKTPQITRVVETLISISRELDPSGGITIDMVAYAWILMIPCKPVIVLGSNDMRRVGKAVESAGSLVRERMTKIHWFRILEASRGEEVP